MTASPSTSHQEALIKEHVQAVLLIKQPAPQSKYFYLMLPVGKVAAFKAVLAEGSTDIATWGTVLQQGEGEPSDAVKKEMQAKFGCAPEGMPLMLPAGNA